MDKTLIIYGSTTGNTESVAENIEDTLKKNGRDVTLLNVGDTSVDILEKDYGVILFGCSTWGEDEIELQEDFIDFYDNMKNSPLGGKTVAVFGCGDSEYEHFCGAVDAIEERAKDLGASIAIGSLKIDGDPDDSSDEITAWANEIINAT